jgi:CelD/BcsL family acetyltransferase involved in cellulose biosynthesis
MQRLTVAEVADPESLEALAAEWTDLEARARERCFFSSWDWTASWLESFRGERRLVALLAREEDRLVGVLPLLERRWRAPLSRPRLEFAANEQSPCACFPHEGSCATVIGAFLDHLARTRGRSSLRLALLPEGAEAHAALREQAAARDLRVFERPGRRSTRIRVEGSWAGYLATRSKHTQREWRRKTKKLHEAGRVETRVVTSRAELPGALQDVLEIEAHSWKHETGTSFQKEAGVEAFYRRLAERCADRGVLRLALLYLDGRAAAHCLAVVHAGELLALKTSFDRALAGVCPGLALMLTLCETAFGEGLAAIDLLGHPDRWKVEMANEERLHLDVCVFPRGLVGCEACAFVEERVEPVLRDRLPSRVTSLGRRALARLRAHHP